MTVIDFTAFIGRLATSSGETILPFFRTSLSIDNKSIGHDFDPVTEADRAAEAVMRRLIKANFPQHGIVGEEFGNEREDAEYVWVLDPDRRHQVLHLGLSDLGHADRAVAQGHAGVRDDAPALYRRALFRRQRLGALFGIDRRAETRGAALRLAGGRDDVHDQSVVDEPDRPRRLRPRRRSRCG